MLVRGILLLALALASGCATERTAQAEFTALQREFLAEFDALRIPAFGPAYVRNLEAIGAAPLAAERTEFFSRWRSRWLAVPREQLGREVRPRYDTLLFEIEFNLERARLEHRYAQAPPPSVPTDGLARLPDAHDWYALYLRRSASRAITPDALFALAETEVARIRAEMRKIQVAQGYAGRDAEWARRLHGQVLADPAEVARRFARVGDAVQAALPTYFAAGVPAPEIRPAPHPTKDTPPGYYMGGVFHFSTFGDRFPARSFGWLYLHEAVPGHHLQQTLHPEPEDDHGFWYPAYVEGWAAYCEDLGGELGVYADRDLFYGKWEWDLVRSARVAIDVGIHHKGWRRDQALAYWRANVPEQEDIAPREIDRITRWPTQVVTYKVGEQALLTLRSDAARRQGARFDIRAFHARVLGLGAMPLSVLERAMQDS